jgi:hypothetical protein
LEGQITIVLESTSHEKTGATGACALEARVSRMTFDESGLCAALQKCQKFYSEIAQLETSSNLARPKGLEPLTGGLETRCSIQLSYERVPDE